MTCALSTREQTRREDEAFLYAVAKRGKRHMTSEDLRRLLAMGFLLVMMQEHAARIATVTAP